MDDAQVDAAVRAAINTCEPVAIGIVVTDEDRAIYRAGLAAGRVAGLREAAGIAERLDITDPRDIALRLRAEVDKLEQSK